MKCKNTQICLRLLPIFMEKWAVSSLAYNLLCLLTDQRDISGGGSQKIGNKCTEAWGVALLHACMDPKPIRL